jgi:hypothetical protein
MLPVLMTALVVHGTVSGLGYRPLRWASDSAIAASVVVFPVPAKA